MRNWNLAGIILVTCFMFACGGGDKGSSGNGQPDYGGNRPEAKPLPIVVIDHKISQLANFARIAQNIQYFHPSEGVVKTNWDQFLQYGMYRMALADDANAQVGTLKALFAEMAPSVKFNEPHRSNTIPENTVVSVWLNRGYRDQTEPLPGTFQANFWPSPQSYNRNVVTLNSNELSRDARVPNALYHRYQLGTIHVEQPLILSSHWVDLNTATKAYRLPSDILLATSFDDPYLCLATAAKTWGVLAHFWPYFKDISIAWDAELEPLLASCAAKSNVAQSLDRALRLALTKLQDNHVSLYVPGVSSPFYRSAVSAEWVEDKAIVSYLEQSTAGVQLGDEILSVDDVPISRIIEERAKLSLKNMLHARSEVMDLMLSRTTAVPIKLELKHLDGQIESVTLPTATRYAYGAAMEDYVFNSHPLHQVLPNQIHYINTSKLRKSDLAPLQQTLLGARGIILDMRSYPGPDGALWSFLSHFSNREIASLPLYSYFSVSPNTALNYKERIQQSLKPVGPFFDVPTIAISSRYSQSQNEHLLGYVQSAKIPILGEQTSGINGTINFIVINGANDRQFFVSFTGLEVRQHDDSRHIGVGAQPDIVVNRSRLSLRNRQDELLIAAQDYLNKKLSGRSK